MATARPEYYSRHHSLFTIHHLRPNYIPRRPRRVSSSAFISPESVSWSYPQRCSSPCRINCATSPSKSNPCSAACLAACSTEMTTSPSVAPPPFSNSSCPDGNDRTSVVPLFPRQRRFNSRIRLSDTNATVAPAPSDGTTFKASSANARQRSESTRTFLWRFTTSTTDYLTPFASDVALVGLRLVGFDYLLDEAVADYVLVREVHELDALDLREDALGLDEPAALARRQIYLRHVARNHRLRPEPYARQGHLHLLARGVLRLVEDDERIPEGAPPHESQRGDFDDALLQHLGDALGVHEVEECVVERAEVGVYLLL